MEISKPIKSKKTKLKKTPYSPKGYLIYYLVLWTIVLSIAFSMSKKFTKKGLRSRLFYLV